MTEPDVKAMRVIVRELFPTSPDEQVETVVSMLAEWTGDPQRAREMLRSYAMRSKFIVLCEVSAIFGFAAGPPQRPAHVADIGEVRHRQATVAKGQRLIREMSQPEIDRLKRAFFAKEYADMPADQRTKWEMRFNPNTNIPFALMVAEQEQAREECPV